MRFMIIRRADADTEADVEGTEELYAAMGAYHEEMVKAGLVRAAEGLHPTSKGALVKFSKGVPTVIDGPFTEAKELIAGFTMIEAGSKQEALEWVKRWPAQDANGEAQIELRQVHEMDDFGDEFTPELREAEERMREQIAATNAGPGRATVTPYLSVPDASTAIAFYAGAFGAVERFRLPHEDGRKTMHAEIEIAGAQIFMSDMGTATKPSGVAIALSLENAKAVDALAARAKTAGAKINVGPEDMFWGDRFAEIEDPFGHTWMLRAPTDS
jgi:uncharacterized glyoxalase superfamily protein PhnB